VVPFLETLLGVFGWFSCKLDCNSVLYVELLAIIIVIEQAHARGCSNFGLKATLRLLYRPLRSHLLFLGTCETVGITFLPGILMTGIFFLQ
jgi:hypothetical protein